MAYYIAAQSPRMLGSRESGSNKKAMIPKITDEMEAFFVAFTLTNEISATASYGIDRYKLECLIATQFRNHPYLTKQGWYEKMARASKEIGSDTGLFMQSLAAAYLNWLYSQTAQEPSQTQVKTYLPNRYRK